MARYATDYYLKNQLTSRHQSAIIQMRGAIPRVPAQRGRALKRLVKSSAAGGSRLMAAFGVYGGLQWTFLFILMNLVFLIAITVNILSLAVSFFWTVHFLLPDTAESLSANPG